MTQLYRDNDDGDGDNDDGDEDEDDEDTWSLITISVKQEDFAVGRLYPDLKRMKEVSIKIATKVAEEAYKWAIVVVVVIVIVVEIKPCTPREGMASTYPEPEDKEVHIRSLLFNHNYEGETNLPKTWSC